MSEERFVGEYRLLEVLPSWGKELWLPDALYRAEHALSRQSALVAVLHPEQLSPPRARSTTGNETELEDPQLHRPVVASARVAVWDRALRLGGVDHHCLPELLESNSPQTTQLIPRPGEQAQDEGSGDARRRLAFLAWQLDRGPTLRERLVTAGGKTPLPPAEALRVLQHVAEGIDTLHSREEIHGGLCPANILLTPIGARLLAPGFCTFNHRRAQGPADGWIYRAPEQLPGGQGPLGPACDVWALGALLYELLTHRPLSEAKALLVAQEPDSASEPPASSGTVEQLASRCRALHSGTLMDELLVELRDLFAGAHDAHRTPELPEEVGEILTLTLAAEASRRTRADEIAHLAHLASRALSSRRVGVAHSRSDSIGEGAAVAASARRKAPAPKTPSRPRVDDWGQSRSWLQQRRAEFDAEEEDTPSWFLWLLPAVLFALVVLFLLLLVAFSGGPTDG